jgi:hypothetical protein
MWTTETRACDDRCGLRYTSDSGHEEWAFIGRDHVDDPSGCCSSNYKVTFFVTAVVY